jgi:cell division protein DivIC
MALFFYFRPMIQNSLPKTPKFLKSFYFIVGSLFFIWLLIFDSNDILTQVTLSNKEKELIDRKNYYESKIAEVKEEREAFLNSEELLEKVAREKFLMKGEDEDVFIVVNEE